MPASVTFVVVWGDQLAVHELHRSISLNVEFCLWADMPAPVAERTEFSVVAGLGQPTPQKCNS